MRFIKSLRYESTKAHWIDGGMWFGWHLVCGLLPVWIMILFLRCFSQDISISVFTNNADFALYSASFAGTCLYIVIKDFKVAYPSRGLLSLIIVPLLLFSALVYAVVALLNVLQGTTDIGPILSLFDKDFMRNVNIFLLPFMFILTFLIVVGDNIRSEPDVRRLSGASYDSLEKRFEELEDTER